MTKIAESGAGSGARSGSIRLRHGSTDPNPLPDPYHNVMDPQFSSATELNWNIVK